MKRIIYIAGDPGTGKTTVGLEIAKQLKAAFIDKDTMCDPLTHFITEYLGEENPKESDLYERHLRTIEYHSMERLMAENILCVDDIVMVAPFGKEIKPDSEYFQNLKYNLKKEHHIDVEILIFIITCSPEENKRRIIERNRKDDWEKLNQWDKYSQKRKLGEKKDYHIYTEAEVQNDNVQNSVQKIMEYLF
jgi:dephospho-CoA kinase